ncbi:hypothetical protein ABPG74_008257 [Tetrahymena malaccensis]
MWNNLACTSYDICSTRRITEAQRRHLQSLTSVKPSIDTRTPWQPSHSLSKWTNKYTNQRNQKIQHDNKVLLEKMMVIDKKSSNMNPKKIAQEIYPIKSMADYQRRRNQENLKQENNKIIERIDNATQKSNYGKQMWLKESKKFEQYKSNILRSKSKIQGIDYTKLTKINYPNEHFMVRKISTPNINNQAYYSNKPKTPSGRLQDNRQGNDIDFQL